MENKIDVIIGKNIKRLRDAMGWTQEDLASKIALNGDGVISLWERGLKGVGKANLMLLCHAFKVKIHEFYLEDDTPIARDEIERNMLYIMRQAEPLQLREEIARYGYFAVEQEALKKPKVSRNEGG